MLMAVSSEMIIWGVRWSTHTGLPRRATVDIVPAAIVDKSTSMGAPADLARSVPGLQQMGLPLRPQPLPRL